MRRAAGDQERRDVVGGGAPRRRWFDVRVSTDTGEYEGRLRLSGGRSALQQLIDDERTYLGLWDARRAGDDDSDEYLVLHKAAIRSITICGSAEPVEETA